MESRDDRVRHAAIAIADTIEAWPDTTWDDVRATNERAGWVDAGAGDRVLSLRRPCSGRRSCARRGISRARWPRRCPNRSTCDGGWQGGDRAQRAVARRIDGPSED